MTNDIETRVRNYTEFFISTVEPITRDEVKLRPLGVGDGLVRPIRPMPPTSRRRGWLVAATAATVVLVLVSGAALLFGDASFVAAPVVPSTVAQSAPVVPSTVTQSTPVTAAEPATADTPGCEIPSGWVQVCDPASFNGGAMYAVTAGGPGFVAVGANGLEYYTRENHADDSWDYGGEASPGVADAVVWTSSDGLTWTRVPHDVATFGGDGGQQMFGVTVGGPGLVAVGRDGPVADGEGTAAVWTSPDGFVWSRVPHDEDVFGGDGEQRMVSVTVGGSGLVAVGFDRPAEEGQGNAVVWTSPDGFVWSRVPHDEEVFGGKARQVMLSVTAGGPGLVAVGTDGYSYKGDDEYYTEVPGELAAVELAADAAVWTSPDGFTWSRVPHDEAIFGGLGEQRMESVTAGGPGLVAVGSATGKLVGRYAFDAAVWTSPDGFAWSRVPHNEAIFATSGGERYPGAHEEQMLSVTAGGPGLVAVGFDSVDDCGWDSAVWTSPDGFVWSRVPDERDCSTTGTGPYDRMLSVTVGPSGLVAVGEEHSPGGAAAVWRR